MKAIVVDDEELARFDLRRLLRAHPEIEIIGEAKDGDEALRLIEERLPEVLFLDIQMPGMTGFDLLEKLEYKLPDVIFTTAYDQHAIKAFEVNALDYLLKPIAPDRLNLAVNRVGTRRRASHLPQVFVRDGDRCWIVRVSDIFLLESEGNYTRLFFAAERPLIRRSLSAIEQQLESHSFFRANRRQVVNLDWIESTQLVVDGGLSIRLRGGRSVELSRRRSDELRLRLSL
jgi:two-component system, LytTR family, response regulator